MVLTNNDNLFTTILDNKKSGEGLAIIKDDVTVVIPVKNEELTINLDINVTTYTFNISFDCRLSDIYSGLYILKTQDARELDLSLKGFITEVEIAAQMVIQHNVIEVTIGCISAILKRLVHRITQRVSARANGAR